MLKSLGLECPVISHTLSGHTPAGHVHAGHVVLLQTHGNINNCRQTPHEISTLLLQIPPVWYKVQVSKGPSNTVKLRAVDWSTVKFWTILSKGHSA